VGLCSPIKQIAEVHTYYRRKVNFRDCLIRDCRVRPVQVTEYPSDTWLSIFPQCQSDLGIAVPQKVASASEKRFGVISVPQAPELQLSVPAE
jgi:hypothetical protein